METKRSKRKGEIPQRLGKTIFILICIFYLNSDSNAFCMKQHHHGYTILRFGTSRGYGRNNLFTDSERYVKSSTHEEEDESASKRATATLDHLNVQMSSSRRKVLQNIATSSVLLSLLPTTANAGVAQIDSKSGELYSPKKEMLGGGGSDLTRGIKLQSRSRGERSSMDYNGLGKDKPFQSVYDTRFITYLSRFLLNYDTAASSFWNEQKFESKGKMSIESQQKLRFAEFAESVEVGLADYFVGPYGSYASVKAGKVYFLLVHHSLLTSM